MIITISKSNSSFLLAIAASILASSPTLANTCGASCETDFHCHQGGFVECGACNKVPGTLGYKTCYNANAQYSSAPTAAPTHNYFPVGGSCALSCTTDSDCESGGFNPCGSCGTIPGTETYGLCYQPEMPEAVAPLPEEAFPTPAPTHDFFPVGGSCSNSCSTDSDCQVGGFNPCGSCGTIPGTAMFGLCYQPEPQPAPTSAPTHDFFPVGGSCSSSCSIDSDCQVGGFNPCGSCGTIPGTQMFGLCYQPEEPEAFEPQDVEATDSLPVVVASGSGSSSMKSPKSPKSPKSSSADLSSPDSGDRRLNTCGSTCESDNDCHDGGFVQCGKCNLMSGTLGYKTCYDDQAAFTNAPTPAPSHNYFPVGGACSDSCVIDSDCEVGGFNACGKCGQIPGTEMYGKCFAPEMSSSGSQKLRRRL